MTPMSEEAPTKESRATNYLGLRSSVRAAQFLDFIFKSIFYTSLFDLLTPLASYKSIYWLVCLPELLNLNCSCEVAEINCL